MKFSAKMDELPAMLQWVRSHLSDLKPSIQMKIELACEEALVNIINHAYQRKGGEVEILFEKPSPGQIAIALKDQGPPFNPLNHQRKELLPLEEQEEGGLGIHFIRSSVDEVLYERKGNSNILTLRLRL